MPDLQWQRDGEGKRKLHHRGKLCQGKVASFFFSFRHFFPMKCFPDQNYLSAMQNSPCRKVCLTNTFSEDTLIYVKNL